MDNGSVSFEAIQPDCQCKHCNDKQIYLNISPFVHKTISFPHCNKQLLLMFIFVELNSFIKKRVTKKLRDLTFALIME